MPVVFSSRSCSLVGKQLIHRSSDVSPAATAGKPDLPCCARTFYPLVSHRPHVRYPTSVCRLRRTGTPLSRWQLPCSDTSIAAAAAHAARHRSSPEELTCKSAAPAPPPPAAAAAAATSRVTFGVLLYGPTSPRVDKEVPADVAHWATVSEGLWLHRQPGEDENEPLNARRQSYRPLKHLVDR